MDVLVAGAGGLLGGEVVRALDGVADVHAFTHAALDITDPGDVREAVDAARPDAVVNCAALTNVDACEEDPDHAHEVNAWGAGRLAEAAARTGAEIVHVSTDYVFDGEKGTPYVESDAPGPVQVYGLAKLAGEGAVRERCDRAYVVRSAWIHGLGGRNFLSRVPGMLREGAAIRAVGDQWSSPTYAPDLARAIVGLLGTGAYGIHHVVNEGGCSYAEWCRAAAERLGGSVEVIAGADLGRPAPRPRDTRLETRAHRDAGFPPLRSWSDALDALLGV